MLARKKKGICLPCVDLVTKMLEFTGYNLEEEYWKEDVTKIGERTLGMMRYEIINAFLWMFLIQSYQRMIHAITYFGPGYKGLNYHAIRTNLLSDMKTMFNYL